MDDIKGHYSKPFDARIKCPMGVAVDHKLIGRHLYAMADVLVISLCEAVPACKHQILQSLCFIRTLLSFERRDKGRQ